MMKQAVSKGVRISASKAREVTHLIQGLDVDEAMALLDNSPRKAARLVGKTLRSAVANAENDLHSPVPSTELVVQEAIVGEGPSMRRIQYKSRGRAGRIKKRTCHIRVVVGNEE